MADHSDAQRCNAVAQSRLQPCLGVTRSRGPDDGDWGKRVDEVVAHGHHALDAVHPGEDVVADRDGLGVSSRVTTPSLTMTEYQLGSDRAGITWLMISTLRLVKQCRIGVWLWPVDPQHWMAAGSGSSYRVHRIIRLAEQEGGALPHPIVLMHNQPAGTPATVSALPAIIRFFRSRGYRFVSL